MAQILKVSTAYTFRIGPFVDSTDGFTPETALTIAYTDCLLSKAGGAFAAKADTTNLTGTGTAQGYYTCVLNTTDTGTVGALRVHIYVSGALPVWRDFQVVNAVTYDSLFSTAGADYLQVDLQQIGGAAVATGTAQIGVNVVNFGGSAGTFASGIPAVNTTQAAGTAWGSGAITAASIATGAITSGKFAAGAIDAAAIATGAVDADALATDAVSEIADGILDRNMGTGSDSGSPTVRTVRQALRLLRNKTTVSGGTLTVTKEDDSTSSWTATVTTNASAEPIIGIDPA